MARGHCSSTEQPRLRLAFGGISQATYGAIGRLICVVKEGEAVVPIYLLAQLAVICHGYQRLVRELDKIRGIHTTTG